MKDEQFTPRAVLFDMDGLMLDTEAPVIPLWREAAKKFGKTLDDDILLGTIGRDGPSTRKMFLDRYGADFPYDRIVEELMAIIRDSVEKNGIPHRPGLIKLLDHLHSLGIPKAVATSTNRQSALWKLKEAKIYDYFDAFACGDEVTNGKPAPDIFLLAAGRLGKKPEECIGFEDSTAGLRSLAAAGIKSVFIRDLVQPPEDVMKTVWRQFKDLSEASVLFTE